MPRLKTIINKPRAHLANRKYGNPSDEMKVIGVTGTHGKTTVVHLLYHIFNNAGIKAGFLSSVGYTVDMQNFNNEINANKVKVGQVHKLLKEMRDNGMQVAIIEVTSKNLKDDKYDGVKFDSGIITNINNPESSHYSSWDDYAKTKLEFIKKIKNEGLLIINNHENLLYWLQTNSENIKNNIFTHWVDATHGKNVKYYIDGITFDIDGYNFAVPIIGHMNYINALFAIRLAQNYIPTEKITDTLKFFETPPGRLQVVQKTPFMVIVDYAKSAWSIENSLQFLSAIKPKYNRIITVLGAPGEEDKSRRVLGEVARKYSGLVILCADDPRSEKTADINTELYSLAEANGATIVERFSSAEEFHLINKASLKKKVERVVQNKDIPFITFDADDYTSRLNAIEFAVKFAQSGDIIYITGKGDETSLSFSNVIYEWSDFEAVKKALDER